MTTEIDDITFLKDVISVLDNGWITGTMCTNAGKCLVGAGAAVLGWQYVPAEELEEFFGQDDNSWVAYNVGAEAKEREAATRLHGLLGLRDDDVRDFNEYYVEDFVDEVIELNDSKTSYSELRPLLVEKLNILEVEGANS